MFTSQLSQKPIGDGLNFVTGNKNKFGEADKALPGMTQLDIDLDEIQSLTPEDVLKHKILSAREQFPGAIVVEDTSVEFVGCGGFPGPLIKWLTKAYPLERIIQFASPKDNNAAIARVTLGYSSGKNEEIIYVTAEIPGKIVAPRGDKGFGWDPIFQPDEQDFDPPKTFGEMTPEEKAAFSMRPMAFKKLANIIEQERIRKEEKRSSRRGFLFNLAAAAFGAGTVGLMVAQNVSGVGVTPDEAFEDFRRKREGLLTSKFFHPEGIDLLSEADKVELQKMIDETITSAQIWKRIASPLIYDQLSMVDPQFHTYAAIEKQWDETISVYENSSMLDQERINKLKTEYLEHLPQASQRLDGPFYRPTHPEELIEFQQRGVTYLRHLKNIRALLE